MGFTSRDEHGGTSDIPNALSRTTLPRSEEMYPVDPARVWSRFDRLIAYFDSGVHPPGSRIPDYITLGYAICRPEANAWRSAISAASSTSGPGQPASFWGLQLDRLLPQHRELLASSAAGRGTQLYDLVAAHGAAVALRSNGFIGHAEFVGDGDAVIQFMNGRDTAISLRVGELEFAKDLRGELLSVLSGMQRVTWRWVQSAGNLADTAVKELHKNTLEVMRQQASTAGVAHRRGRRSSHWPFKR